MFYIFKIRFHFILSSVMPMSPDSCVPFRLTDSDIETGFIHSLNADLIICIFRYKVWNLLYPYVISSLLAPNIHQHVLKFSVPLGECPSLHTGAKRYITMSSIASNILPKQFVIPVWRGSACVTYVLYRRWRSLFYKILYQLTRSCLSAYDKKKVSLNST